MTAADHSLDGGTLPSSDSVKLEALCGELARIAPLRLAESWDNVGLLVGDRTRKVSRIVTCLTITPAVVDEVEAERADLVVTHHPLPFKGLVRITGDSLSGRMLLRLIQAGAAIYSAHTAYDSATEGINEQWAAALGVVETAPLIEPEMPAGGSTPGVSTVVAANEPSAPIGPSGAGRYGRLPATMSLESFIDAAASLVGATHPRRVGPAGQPVRKVAFACGSGGSFLSAAQRRGCDALLTGEATFHTCLEAEASGVGLGLLGHYWSERFAMERLAERLSVAFPQLTIWPSRRESDPLAVVRRSSRKIDHP